MGGNDDLALRIAVAEGVVSSAEAAALGDAAARGGRGVLEHLHADGRISEPTLASLRARVAERAKLDLGSGPTVRDVGERVSDYAETWNHRAATGAPAGVDSEVFPVPGWDRYEPVRLLGRGGMGRVFLARDLRLGRSVAIKFVRDDDPDLARRIVGEARAQARVNDDRVCKVYEVGEVHGRVYIAMQHIDGKPLSELQGELTYEQLAIVMRGAALGVSEAHRAGLIHRDLKPANILVERAADGELRPFVVDFGLARDWTGGATMTGAVLGTPAFMAPEQARGEVARLDRRADVYSLGATLYAMLTKQPPFAGSNQLVVLTRVSTDEPARPRAIDPDIPPDLEAIALKCLEKDRAARYESARALADDLGRFLAGEPVAARASAGIGYRLRKQLRRHARLIAGIATAVVLVALALGYALHERGQSGRREALARRFTERVERVESMARYAALAPAHDLRPDRARLRRAMDELGAEIDAAGEVAAGPGHYALGRGALALGDDDRAEAHLTQAWERGFREGRVAYALALAEGRLYERGLREVERLSRDLPAELRAQRLREVEQRYREPALRYLRASGPEVPSPAYVAALIAFYERRFDDALGQLDAYDRAGDTRPWFYEVPLLRGQVLIARARARSDRGEAALASADFEAARRALDTAAAIGESDPVVHRARAQLEVNAFAVELFGGGAVDAPFAAGVAATGRILALLPDDAEALTLRARLLCSLADHRGRRGGEYTDLLARAIDDARAAVALAPPSRDARLALASIYRQWGEIRQGRNQDPGDQLGRAVAELTAAIPESARDAQVAIELGLIHTVWADHLDGVGGESSAHRGKAIEAYARAVQVDDRLVDAWLNLGNNYARRAAQPNAADPDGDLARALEALSRGRALEAANSAAYLYEGDVYAAIAQREQARGALAARDRDRAKAIELYRRGSAISPDEPAFYNAISIEQVRQAQDEQARGRDPLPLLERAEATARQAIAAAPDQGFGYSNAGDALMQRANYLRGRGRGAGAADPLVPARAAETAFQQALERLPDHPSIWLNRAIADLFVASVEVERGIDPRPRLALAGTALDRLRALNPGEPQLPKLLDEAGALRARWPAPRRER